MKNGKVLGLKLVMQTVLKFGQARLSPPTYGQIASEAALDTPQSYFDEVIAEYKERRDILVQELQKIINEKEGLKILEEKGLEHQRIFRIYSAGQLTLIDGQFSQYNPYPDNNRRRIEIRFTKLRK